MRTLAVHAGEGIDPVTRASSPNLVMSATFAPEEVTGFSAHNRRGYQGFSYARLSNPTVKQLEDKLAALEGAEAGQCYASGMAASSAVLLGRLSAGDHLVISDTNYVGTVTLASSDTDPGVILPADYTFTAADGGVRSEGRVREGEHRHDAG